MSKYPGYINPLVLQQYEPPVPSLANLAQAFASSDKASKAKSSSDKEPNVEYKGTHDVLANDHEVFMNHLRTVSKMQTIYGGTNYKNNPEFVASVNALNETQSKSYNAFAAGTKDVVNLFQKRINGGAENGTASSGDISDDFIEDAFLQGKGLVRFKDVSNALISTGNPNKQEAIIQEFNIESTTLSGTADAHAWIQKKINEYGLSSASLNRNGGYTLESRGGEMDMGGKTYTKLNKKTGSTIGTNEDKADKTFYKIFDDIKVDKEASQGLFSSMVKERPSYFMPVGSKIKRKGIDGKEEQITINEINVPITPDNFNQFFEKKPLASINNLVHNKGYSVDKKGNKIPLTYQDAAKLAETAEGKGAFEWSLKPEYTLLKKDGTPNRAAYEWQKDLYIESKVAQVVNIQRAKENLNGSSTFTLVEAKEEYAKQKEAADNKYSNPLVAVDQYIATKNSASDIMLGFGQSTSPSSAGVPMTKQASIIANSLKRIATGEIPIANMSLDQKLVHEAINKAADGGYNFSSGTPNDKIQQAAIRLKSGAAKPEDYRLVFSVLTDGKAQHTNTQNASLNSSQADNIAQAISTVATKDLDAYRTLLQNKGASATPDEKLWLSSNATVRIPVIAGSLTPYVQQKVNAYTAPGEDQIPRIEALNNTQGLNVDMLSAVIAGDSYPLRNYGFKNAKYLHITENVTGRPLSDQETEDVKNKLAYLNNARKYYASLPNKDPKKKAAGDAIAVAENELKKYGSATTATTEVEINGKDLKRFLNSNTMFSVKNKDFTRLPNYNEIRARAFNEFMKESKEGKHGDYLKGDTWKGKSDDALIYQEKVISQKVKDYYNSNSGGPKTPISEIGKFRMDEGDEVVNVNGVKFSRPAYENLNPRLKVNDKDGKPLDLEKISDDDKTFIITLDLNINELGSNSTRGAEKTLGLDVFGMGKSK